MSEKAVEAGRKEWEQFRRQASIGFVGLSNKLVDSEAFKAVTSGSAVKTLIWFWQQAEYPRSRKKGQDSPVGNIDKIINNGNISFTFRVAGWRGLTSGQFSRALKELHRLGFIDVMELGRGVDRKFTKFALSRRWEKYNRPGWEEIPFPENFREGFRIKREKVNRAKTNVINALKHTLGSGEIDSQRAQMRVENSPSGQFSTCANARIYRSGHGLKNLKGSKKKVSIKGLKVQRTAAAQFQRDGNPEFTPWAEDEAMVMTFDGSEATH